jgi:hypothetical protein
MAFAVCDPSTPVILDKGQIWKQLKVELGTKNVEFFDLHILIEFHSINHIAIAGDILDTRTKRISRYIGPLEGFFNMG